MTTGIEYEHPRDRLPLIHAPYRSTLLRGPQQPLVLLPHRLTELTGPVFGDERLVPGDDDLTQYGGGTAAGQRILVRGRVLDGAGRPVPRTLLEVWQANAAGRYRHPVDQWAAPLDPHFNGLGRMMTDDLGRYQLTTIRPGAYPWRNHHNAWRPAHLHFSLFGSAFAQRLVTQMYFPDDPLLPFDPIFNAVPDAAGRSRLVSSFDLERSAPDWALAFTFDIVLRGPAGTPFETGVDDE